MGRRIRLVLALLLSMVTVSEAQIPSGTMSSKTLDGVGNKITSTVTGPSRGIDINCLAGCTGAAGGATEVTLALLNAKFVIAYLDADAIVNQTTTAVHGQSYMYNGVTWDRVRGTIAGGVLVNISNVSLPVTGTFFQVTQPVSGTFFQATQPISVISLPLPTGAATEATLATLLTTTGFQARINTLGQKTMANSTPVVLSSDQTAIPVTVLSTVATANNDGACLSGAISFTVIASNASRTWLALWASPANTDDVYIKLGATATNADGRLAPGQIINFTSGRIYTGIVDAIPNSGTQAVCVMELN